MLGPTQICLKEENEDLKARLATFEDALSALTKRVGGEEGLAEN